jgi:Domain of unknown function (DUF4189)
MRLAALLLCFTGFCLPSTSLRAQQMACPPGSVPIGGGDAGWSSCSPVSGQGETTPPDPGPEWATRWGAIATANGAFGTANNFPIARKAEKAAMNRCQANGGKDCVITLSFANQCAALAWGSTVNSTKAAANIGEAEGNAMSTCNAEAGNCKIYYSACSYPERIR